MSRSSFWLNYLFQGVVLWRFSVQYQVKRTADSPLNLSPLLYIHYAGSYDILLSLSQQSSDNPGKANRDYGDSAFEFDLFGFIKDLLPHYVIMHLLCYTFRVLIMRVFSSQKKKKKKKENLNTSTLCGHRMQSIGSAKSNGW